MITADHKVVIEDPESRLHHKHAALCKTWRRNGFDVIHAKPSQLRRRRDVFEPSYTPKKVLDAFYGQFSTKIFSSTRTYSTFLLSDTSWRTAHTLSTFMVQGRTVKNSIKSSLLTCLAWAQRKPHPRLGHPMIIIRHIFWVLTLQCLVEWTFPTQRLGAQQWNWYGRKVCTDSGFHTRRWRRMFSYVRHAVAASRECKCCVVKFCIGNVLTRWVRPPAESIKSPTDTVSDRCESLAITVPLSVTLIVQQQFFDLKKLFNWLNNEHVKLWMFSAKRLDALCLINKDNFSLPLMNTRRLRRKTVSILWQTIANHTITTCRYKFDSSNKKQLRDFRKHRGNCCLACPRKQIKLLKISDNIW